MQGKKREAGSLPASLVFLLLSLFMGPHRRTAAGCHCLLFGVLLGCGAEGIWKSDAGGAQGHYRFRFPPDGVVLASSF